jgi:uncharacterized protein (TIGR02145 family)
MKAINKTVCVSVSLLLLVLSVCAPAQSGANTFTDARDGKKYRTVKIGEQTWMAENLNYKTDRSWCYDNNSDSCKKYGRLYFWTAAMEACPAGWRLPDTSEWDVLSKAAGGRVIAGKNLKAASGWEDDNGKFGNGLDIYGFSALPSGFYFGTRGGFTGAGKHGGLWTATEHKSAQYPIRDAYCWRMDFYSDGGGWGIHERGVGLAVRCVKGDVNTRTSIIEPRSVKKGSFADGRDGKAYRTVKIGNQNWMAENLNYLTDTSWCYGDDTSNCDKYGRLYDWNAAMRACPAGWHLPTREEWAKLFNAIGGDTVAGGKLKSKWPKWDGTDDYGFSAMPGGYYTRYWRCCTAKRFTSGGLGGLWWTASEHGESGGAYSQSMDTRYKSEWNYNNKAGNGFSVRCVEDD